MTPMALLSNGRFGAIAGKNPCRSLKLHLRAAANAISVNQGVNP